MQVTHQQPVDWFALFNANLYGPEPGEPIDQDGLELTLQSLDLDPGDARVLAQFKRWWGYHGGSLHTI